MKSNDLKPYLEHIKTLDLRAFMSMAKHMQENSALDILHEIDVPVLIISGEDDLFTPWEISREMQRLIPDAEMLTIPKGSHAALVEQPELMNLRIEKFIRERLLDSAWGKPKPKKSVRKTAKKPVKRKVAAKKAAPTKVAAKKAKPKKAAVKKTAVKKPVVKKSAAKKTAAATKKVAAKPNAKTKS